MNRPLLNERLETLLSALALVAMAGLAFGLFDGTETNEYVPSIAARLEYWFFDTKGSSASLVTAAAAWMAWRRRSRLMALPETTRRAVGAVPFVLAIAVFVWAELNDAADLRVVALALLLAAYAGTLRGISGIRVMTLPTLILFFALPIPYPLNNEIIWSLQNLSASGTAEALGMLGVEIERIGAHLRRGDVNFLVVEGCSGLRSLMTLTLAAFVIRELLGDRTLRGWIPVLVAPPLALVFNIVRISAIVLGSSADDPSLGEEHLGQGLVVLAAGSIALFIIGHFTASESSESDPPTVSTSRRDRLGVGAMLAVLCVAHLLVEPWPSPASVASGPAVSTQAQKIDFPIEHPRWNAEKIELDYAFLGVLPRGAIERRLYRRNAPVERLGDRTVDLLIASSSTENPRGSPISSKLMVPGRAWQTIDSEVAMHYTLGREINVSTAISSERRALVYTWSVGEEGFWRDTARSFLALERGPFARPKPRFMIQVATELGDEPEAEANARQMLNGFLLEFRTAFRVL